MRSLSILRLAGKAPIRQRPVNSALGVTMNILNVMDTFDLSCLADAAMLVDSKLDLLEEHAALSADPDSEGIYDRAEYLVGFGLVACQAYITEVISMSGHDRTKALDLGPTHSCGRTIATLVNALANYWKHASEWKAPLSRRAETTVEAISALGVDVDSSYVAVNALYEIVRPQKHRVGHLVPLLSQWRRTLHEARERPGG